jgi:hypothetical protein
LGRRGNCPPKRYETITAHSLLVSDLTSAIGFDTSYVTKYLIEPRAI